jgi:hypothetical protein
MGEVYSKFSKELQTILSDKEKAEKLERIVSENTTGIIEVEGKPYQAGRLSALYEKEMGDEEPVQRYFKILSIE